MLFFIYVKRRAKNNSNMYLVWIMNGCHNRASKFDHITPVLCELHWLPICHCIRFKLAMIMFICLNGLAPSSLADDYVLVSSVASRRHLWSADTWMLVVCRTRTVLGTRDFAISSAVVWNLLSANIRVSSLNVATFAKHLKNYLFIRLD